MDFLANIKTKFKAGDALFRLMIINAGIFVFINIVLLLQYVTKSDIVHTAVGDITSGSNGTNWFHRLPEDLTLAASSDPVTMLTRPWSLITHMFTHIQFGHFLFNMVALYTMGQIFVSILGSRKLTALYIMGGLSGFALFALAFNFLEVFQRNHESYVLGASAAVMAVTVAAATLRPKQILYLFGAIKLELMWLAAILVLLDLVSVRDGVNSGGHIGHIGGAFYGYFYALQIKKGKEPGAWINRVIDKFKSLFSKRKMKVASRNARAKSDEQFNLDKKSRQKRIDEILDRIGKSGYDSLSKDEKDFLFQNSQK